MNDLLTTQIDLARNDTLHAATMRKRTFPSSDHQRFDLPPRSSAPHPLTTTTRSQQQQQQQTTMRFPMIAMTVVLSRRIVLSAASGSFTGVAPAFCRSPLCWRTARRAGVSVTALSYVNENQKLKWGRKYFSSKMPPLATIKKPLSSSKLRWKCDPEQFNFTTVRINQCGNVWLFPSKRPSDLLSGLCFTLDGRLGTSQKGHSAQPSTSHKCYQIRCQHETSVGV